MVKLQTKNRNCKLEAKFLGFFRVLYLIKKQVYQLELPKKQTIHNVFPISLQKQKQDIIRKRRFDKMSQIELEESNDKNYKVEEICNSEVYTKD